MCCACGGGSGGSNSNALKLEEYASEPHSQDYLKYRTLKEIDYSIDRVRYNVRNKIMLDQKGMTPELLKIKLEQEGHVPFLEKYGNQIEEEKENEIDDERARKKISKPRKLVANNYGPGIYIMPIALLAYCCCFCCVFGRACNVKCEKPECKSPACKLPACESPACCSNMKRRVEKWKEEAATRKEEAATRKEEAATKKKIKDQ